MIKALSVAVALLLATVIPALASSTGGDVASVAASSSCLTVSTGAGPSAAVTLGQTGQVIDGRGSAYTVLNTDSCKIVWVGNSSGTPTLTVPQSTTFTTGFGAAYHNVGSVTMNVIAGGGSSSVFEGAGGGTSFTLPANGGVFLTAAPSGNWDAWVTGTTVSPPAGPVVVQSGPSAQAACGTGTGFTTCSQTLGSATGSGAGRLLAVGIATCSTSTNCTTGGGAITVSSVTDGGDTCVQSTSSVSPTGIRTMQWWTCPLGASRTSVTATFAAGVTNPQIFYVELSGAATTSSVDVAQGNYADATSVACGVTTTAANDILLYADYDGTATMSPGTWTDLTGAAVLWDLAAPSAAAYSGTLTLGSAAPLVCSVVAIKAGS